LSRSSGSAITSGVSPTCLRRGATGTPALLRRAIARRESPPPAIGIESRSCSEFRAGEVPLLIIDPPGQGQLPPWLRRTNIWLRVTSPPRGAKRPRGGKFNGSAAQFRALANLANGKTRCGSALPATSNRWYVSSPPSSDVPARPLRTIQRGAAGVAAIP